MTSPSESEGRVSQSPGSPDIPGAAAEFVRELYERLSQRGDRARRYQVKEQIGQGGMGRILLAHDQDLHRDVAMKVIRDVPDEEQAGVSRSVRLARFLEEAQVTGQLDHPGIVPVHELGLDERGHVFFTMKRVRGEDLSQVLQLAREGRDGWNQARVVSVLLKVCEAMAYAHTKGVVHRDLKPSNIRIGRFGEVYVMDWGLARVLGRPDVRDLRLREPDASVSREVVSDRAAQRAPASPLQTMDDTPIGTPMFMSPEQALGHLERIDRRTDVYALGAVLYTVLTGQMPYVNPATRVEPWTIVRWIREGPPAPVHELAPRADPELTAVCEKAMSRDPAERYADMNELAEELRAYLENRVVRAHRSGPMVELSKWVRRNRSTALAICAVLAVVASAGFVLAFQQSARNTDLRRSADAFEAASLLRDAPSVGPLRPDCGPAIERWLDRAARLLERSTPYSREYQRLVAAADARDGGPHSPDEFEERATLACAARARADAYDELLRHPEKLATLDAWQVDEVTCCLRPEVQIWRALADRLELPVPVVARATFADVADQGRHDALRSILIDAFAIRTELYPLVESRLAKAYWPHQPSNDEWDRAWEDARSSIRDLSRCPAYGGAELPRQLGLFPLRMNPATGLWEFWYVPSGLRPQPSRDGGWDMASDTGMVLVLVPGGDVFVGAQASDPRLEHFDLDARRTEAPEHVRLDWYFLSCYEMTKGQWMYVVGADPDEYVVGTGFRNGERITRSHPVEHVSYEECCATLSALGLTLPTEVQWERAARGDSSIPYSTSDRIEDLGRCVNFRDASFARYRGEAESEFACGVDDGYAFYAPVGSFQPNGFGFHEMLGNVSEWCLDAYGDDPQRFATRSGTGLRTPTLSSWRVYRGGDFKSEPKDVRVTSRFPLRPTERDDFLGLRPARPVVSTP